MRGVLAMVLVPALAHAERYAVVGDVGTWPSDHSSREVHTGVEASVDTRAGELVVLGAAADLQRVWYQDDECFGFHGWRGDVAGLIGLDTPDPGIAGLRYVLQARLGLAWLHRAPTCTMALPARDDVGVDLAGIAGVELGRVRVQVTVARPTYGLPNEPIEVTVGVGMVWR